MGAALQMEFTLEKQAIYNGENSNHSKYSRFSSRKDFNQQWALILKTYKDKLRFTKLQLRVIGVIVGFAGAKNFGVCSASFKKINKKFKEKYGTNISRDTWRTVVDRCAKYGILSKHDGIRLTEEGDNKSRTANVLIFYRADEVRAYEIARAAETAAEMERLLEEEYARMTPQMTFAFNAKKWGEEKALKRAEQEEKERREAQKRAEEEKKAKYVSLYVKINSYIQAKKLDLQAADFVGIAYGSVKKLMGATNISKVKAEEIAYSNFLKAVNTDKSKVKKNYAALYSWLMKDTTSKLTGQAKEMTDAEIADKQGRNTELPPQFMIDAEQDPIKRAALQADRDYKLQQLAQGREKIPAWFDKRNEQRATEQPYTASKDGTIDFEKAKQAFLKRLEEQQ